PESAFISPRLEVHEGLDARRGVAIFGAGVLGGVLAAARLRRK
ncbi:MAG: inner membrane protein YhjD, partial [Rhodococcus sp.]|nr:inner membrane protein YhjD [Rhodococcus sp. (in: high G+C Gram-positive bacteria)]